MIRYKHQIFNSFLNILIKIFSSIYNLNMWFIFRNYQLKKLTLNLFEYELHTTSYI